MKNSTFWNVSSAAFSVVTRMNMSADRIQTRGAREMQVRFALGYRAEWRSVSPADRRGRGEPENLRISGGDLLIKG